VLKDYFEFYDFREHIKLWKELHLQRFIGEENSPRRQHE